MSQSVPLIPVTNSFIDSQSVTECISWLSFHRIWGQLNQDTLTTLANSLQLIKVDAKTEIFQTGNTPQGLYLIKWGTVEIYRISRVGKTHLNYCNTGKVFGYIPLLQPEETPTYPAAAITVTKSEIWFLHREIFDRLNQEHPDFQKVINHLLVQDLGEYSQRLERERERIQGLQPYLHPLPKGEKIIGNGKASLKLKEKIQNLTDSSKTVVLQGPPGSGKSFISGVIHLQSILKEYPFAQIDLAQLTPETRGEILLDAIALLERGTLAIDNVQLLNSAQKNSLVNFLKTGEINSQSPQTSLLRLILASHHHFNLSEVETETIKLPNLIQRKEDIEAFAQHFLQHFCQERGRNPLTLNQADIRRLLSYNYPENLSELAAILKRAVIMTPPEQTEIPEQALWSVESGKNTFRVDLLNEISWLRPFLLSKWWPERFWIIMMIVFVPVTILGFTGPQTRDSSVTLNLFWAWWWPFYLLLFPLVGRLWCAVCPFMITAEWLRSVSLWLFPRQLKSWPTKWLNSWGAWVLWAGFVAIYLWEKLWDLPHRAYLSAWLLIIITAGAVIFSLIYERRLWCRYLCPIGGMNGMFAKLAALELRSTQQVCGTQCHTFGCYKGSEATPPTFPNPLATEGQKTQGCPLYSHPAQLKDNRDCVLCMTCLKACPNRSVQVNFRFPAADLLENQQGFPAEVALLLLLLGGPFLHYAEKILNWFGWGNLAIDSEHLLISLPIASFLLTIPWLATYSTHYLAQKLDNQMPEYQKVIYAYLPMTLAANLAYYLPFALQEAGKVLPVTARSFGYSGVGWFSLTWSSDVASFLQGITLLSILFFSFFPLVKITGRPLRKNWLHISLMAIFVFIFFYLMILS
jgi:transcriptional regulator with AAA-type ATPase domain/NAD-dependent dihydropyrimidine dehydrogenase PreA subunit